MVKYLPITLLILAGCGGSTPTPSPFDGSWSGSVTNLGTLSLNVRSGHVQGTFHDQQANVDGTVTGKFYSGGHFEFVISAPGFTPQNWDGTAIVNTNLLGSVDTGERFELVRQ